METPNNQAPSNNQISPERQMLYYAGMALTGVGLLLFISVFFTAAANFGNFDDFKGRTRSEMSRAITGMALVFVGGFMMKIGAAGLAGAGVVLDPEKARKDVEPWSRMQGGVVQDALSEVEIVQKIVDRLDSPEPQVKVRCRNCQTLNDETAKFCNQCGSAM